MSENDDFTEKTQSGELNRESQTQQLPELSGLIHGGKSCDVRGYNATNIEETLKERRKFRTTKKELIIQKCTRTRRLQSIPNIDEDVK